VVAIRDHFPNTANRKYPQHNLKICIRPFHLRIEKSGALVSSHFASVAACQADPMKCIMSESEDETVLRNTRYRFKILN
jgi:hypothetical protein